MDSKAARNQRIVELYLAGATYAEIQRETGLAKSAAGKVLDRAGVEKTRANRHKSGRLKDLIVALLAEDPNLRPREIAERLGANFRTIQQHISVLRRDGRISSQAGTARGSSARARGKVPHTAFWLDIDADTRTLLDGEAADRSTEPAQLAAQIIRIVVNDQDLIDLILGEETHVVRVFCAA